MAHALVVSLTHIDAAKYGGWDGRNGCWGCGIDAARISESLAGGGFSVTSLADDQATFKAVLGGLRSAAKSAKPGDTFFFYFSGHGGQMPDYNGDEEPEYGGRPGSDETLVCYDKELVDDLLDEVWLSFPKGSVIYMVSDSCNSGTNYRNLRTQGASPFRPINRVAARKMKARLLHIGGCRDGFASYGDAEGGTLTKALVQIWSGGAGPQTWIELYEHSCEIISGQMPQLNTYGDGAVALQNAQPFSPASLPVPSTTRRQSGASRVRGIVGAPAAVDEAQVESGDAALESGALIPSPWVPGDSGEPRTRSIGSRSTANLPINEAQARRVTRWLIQHFGPELRQAGAGTVFGPDILCAIVCQETAYFWLPLMERLQRQAPYNTNPGLLADLIVARCVLDASGDYPGTTRNAFPRNTAAFREAYGSAFTNLLIEEANLTRRLRGFGDQQWVYKGYGIFQYDLQYVVDNEDFFRERRWYDFDRCLDRCMGELLTKFRRENDLWEAVRAYNGSGPRARQYRENVRQFAAWTQDEIARIDTEASGSTGGSAERPPKPAGGRQRSLFGQPDSRVRVSGIAPTTRPRLSRSKLLKRLAPFALDRNTYPLIVVGIRGYYLNTMGLPGVNDRGLYDDAIFIDSPDGFASFNGNTDPSRRREGSGYADGTKGMARLKAGAWFAHKFDTHGSSSPHPAICQRLGDVTVIRDGRNGRDYEDTGRFGINIHRGGYRGTSSEGCQTIHPDQWDGFYELAKDLAQRYHRNRWNQVIIPYVLLEE